jgi:putative oxidoreductase
MNAKIIMVLRIVLGLAYLVFGANFFLHFLPMPPMAGDPGVFMGVMFKSGWLTFVKVLEILAGISLLSNQYSRLSAIIIMPITINIFLFHLLVAGNPVMGIIMVLINAAILYGYKEDFKGVLKKS